MTDYFKSAFGYSNGAGGVNEYIGQNLEINGVKLRVNRLIAEGIYKNFFHQMSKNYCYTAVCQRQSETNFLIGKEQF